MWGEKKPTTKPGQCLLVNWKIACRVFFGFFFLLLRKAGRDGSDAQRSPTSLDATLSLPDANTRPAAALQEICWGFFLFLSGKAPQHRLFPCTCLNCPRCLSAVCWRDLAGSCNCKLLIPAPESCEASGTDRTSSEAFYAYLSFKCGLIWQ